MKHSSHTTCHHDQLPELRKIEGQIRGIQKMIDEKRYCVDILMQLYAITAAVRRVQKHIFKNHLDHCVETAFRTGSKKESQVKIDEIFKLLDGYRS